MLHQAFSSTYPYKITYSPLFAAICDYVQLQRLYLMDVLKNCYQMQRNLFNSVVAEFARSFMQGKEHLNP
uniref:Uncharacterized protein n=1 Tax=Candidatus Kentrum sp. MB TaxID=2138164 RepID=A0A450XI00_9GAMM|nr:MAG: hypothetical protein BECKMB1821G_GA0114241_104313 [Candidatus Kentron sp. MB]